MGMETAAGIGTNRLYGDLAWLFPILLPPEDYLAESEDFARIIERSAAIPVRTLLHLGCGGGLNDAGFKRRFRVTGLDASEAMLEQARRRNPEAEYVRGDLKTARLGRTFDAVVAVDSLDYMTTPADLEAAFATAWTHLAPGGVFFFLLETSRERFRQNRTDCWSAAREGVEVVFVENSYDPDPSDTVFETTMIFLVREGGRLRIEPDRHLRGLFGEDRVLDALARAGFVPHAEEYRGGAGGREAGEELAFPLFVALRPGPPAAGGANP